MIVETYSITIVTISDLLEADNLHDRRKTAIDPRYLDELTDGVASDHLHFLKKEEYKESGVSL